MRKSFDDLSALVQEPLHSTQSALKSKAERIESLEYQLTQLRRARFGKSSEKLSLAQKVRIDHASAPCTPPVCTATTVLPRANIPALISS